MTGPIAGVRAYLVDALDPVRSMVPGIEVHLDQTSTSIVPPCLILLAGSPYVEPGTTWGAVAVNLDVRLIVGSTSDAPSRMDALIDAVIAALKSSDVVVGSIPSPTADTEQQVLVVDIPTTTTWQES